MKLSCALVACNENPHYLQYWPIVKRAWWEIVGIPCVMIYVGETVPDAYKNDPAVIHFPPIPEWPTATQAQVIRLLFPGLLQCEGAIIISDMDMIPMQRDFFVKGFEQFYSNQFVSLRGIDELEQQVYMCYVGATPQTWRDLFGIQSTEAIRIKLTEFAKQIQVDGTRGGQGWCTDQMILYFTMKGWKMNAPERIGLTPWTKEIPRLCRSKPSEWMHWQTALETNIINSYYIDFHMPPYEQFKQQIEQVYAKVREPYVMHTH